MDPQGLTLGTVVDEQYAIERELGHGAVGVVYLARDRRLGRNVAFKLAHEASPSALQRASREALALARLSHPNVVAIHQVGVFDGRVYAAMEYVVGTTAPAWCEARRTAREILDVYAAAGAGLAAAHAAGLAHRDFKAENVLVGADGRVRVTDFVGLAAETGRDDQIAFCEALRAALAKKSIPRHVDAALRRGLSRDPWPSLEPLVAELRRHPNRRALAIGGGALAVAVIGFALWPRGGDVDACAGGSERIAAQWTPARARSVHAALVPPNAPAWIVAAANEAATESTEWAKRWATTYRAVCEAAWSPALHDRGTECLARGEHAFDATLATLAEPGVQPERIVVLVRDLPRPESCSDPTYLQATVPPPTNPALASAVASVQNELQRIHVLGSAGEIARAHAAMAEVEKRPKIDYPPLTAQIHYASALIDREASVDDKALPVLVEAYFEARVVGDRVIATRAAADIAVALIDLSRDAEAVEWGRLAEAEIATISEPVLIAGTLRALAVVAIARSEPQRALELIDRAMRMPVNKRDLHNLLETRAQAEDQLGNYADAVVDIAKAEANIVALYGPIHPHLSILDQQLSLVDTHMGRADDAVVAARRGLRIAEATSAPDTATTNNAVGALGVALTAAHQYPEALAMLDRSLAANEKLDGPRSYNVASDRNNRCELLVQLKRFDDAIADCERAIDIWTEILGADGNEIGIATYNIATAQNGTSHFAKALASVDRAIAIFAKQPDNPGLGPAYTARAIAHRGQKQLAEAGRDIARAIELLGKPNSNPNELQDARDELSKQGVVRPH